MNTTIRITSGKYKNIKLQIPKIEGIRVVMDKLRQVVFSMLGQDLTGMTCLDLYAGSGVLGIEALSRNASWCDFVDENYDSKKTILENLAHCKITQDFEAIKDDAVKYVANTEKRYDIIFVDPFYETTSHKFLLKNLEEILNPNGTILFFHGTNLKLEKLLEGTKLDIVDTRHVGAATVHFLKVI